MVEKISLIIPTRNEAKSLEKSILELPRELISEIIIADGHSTDGTLEIAKKLGCKAITQEGKGFGLGIRTGLKYVTGDIIVIMDADGSEDPKDIVRLLEKIKEGYDVGWGSRYLRGHKTPDDTWFRYFGNRILTFLARTLHGIEVTDIMYMFAAYKKEIFNKIKLESSDFTLCIELPLKVHRAGFKFGEIACSERKRFADKSRVNAVIDGWKFLMAILKKY